MSRRILSKSNFTGAYEFGQALDFDGVDDYCSMPLATYPVFTAGFWVKSNRSVNRVVMGRYDNEVYVRYNFADKEFRLRLLNDAVDYIFNMPSDLVDNTWTHFLFSKDSLHNIRVFINGAESSTGAINKDAPNTSFSANCLGSFYSSTAKTLVQFFKGQLDDVFFTNTCNNPASDALKIYNNGLGNSPSKIIPNIKNLYRFNGNTINSGFAGGELTLNNFKADPYVTH